MVGRYGHGVHTIIHVWCPGEHLGRRGRHCRDVRAHIVGDSGEEPAEVDGVVRCDHRSDLAVDPWLEVAASQSRDWIKGCDAVSGLPVDSGEATTHVDSAAVRGGHHAHDLRIRLRRPATDQLARPDVVRQQVRPRGLVDSCGRARRTSTREFTTDVHRVADDRLAPNDPVDLNGRKRVRGHRDRSGWIGLVQRTGISRSEHRRLQQPNQECSSRDECPRTCPTG